MAPNNHTFTLTHMHGAIIPEFLLDNQTPQSLLCNSSVTHLYVLVGFLCMHASIGHRDLLSSYGELREQRWSLLHGTLEEEAVAFLLPDPPNGQERNTVVDTDGTPSGKNKYFIFGVKDIVVEAKWPPFCRHSKCIFLYENPRILSYILLGFVPKFQMSAFG